MDHASYMHVIQNWDPTPLTLIKLIDHAYILTFPRLYV